jgi:peptidoglycan-associated lipoprotein
MKRLMVVATAAMLLAACSSGVKLNDVPVEDKNGTTNGSQNTDPNANGGRTVTPVDLGKNAQDEAMRAANRTVYFDYDSFVIRPEFQNIIESHARILKGDKTKKVAIEGHTDERGGREYNLALGQKRAEAVRRALALQGVSEGQLEAVSFGKEKPADTGATEAAFAKNRRAEISYR